jgi:hypothetical protein
MHGEVAKTVAGKDSRNCQAFMAQYCATKWDNICEYASKDTDTAYPNTLERCSGSSQAVCKGMTSGDILIYNTASRKYLEKMGGTCSITYQPFDPTVASSPIISMWEGSCNQQGNGGCIPVYSVNPKTIDKDPVMNKILAKPKIAFNILVNIYNWALRRKTLEQLKGTKLYAFFKSHPFQNYMRNKAALEKKLNNRGCRPNPLGKRNFTII